MLEKQSWMKLAPDMMIQWKQFHEEGKCVDEYEEECKALVEKSRTIDCEAEAYALTAKMAAAPMRDDYPYREPSQYDEILALLPASNDIETKLDPEILKDKIEGAWIGRIAGCLLGKPVECIRTPLLTALLKASNNYPMSHYIDSSEIPDEVFDDYPTKKDFLQHRGSIDMLHDAAPVDDDTNYTVFALKMVETYGKDFRPNDVLEGWLTWIPMFATCTAERVAYRNAAAGMLAPETAAYHNPYNEWIGAQIRGDFFGYINPGKPRKAAEMAYRDASISHIKNGIYGEMFIAAMIARAAVSNDMVDIVEAGLNEIPPASRLSEDIRKVLSGYRNGMSADMMFKSIHEQYDEFDAHDWCHTNSNAMIVAAALLYGKGDFSRSICMAVQAAFDTDCNGATVGSIVGMCTGGAAIPAYWADTFHRTLLTSLDGYNRVALDNLVSRTLALID